MNKQIDDYRFKEALINEFEPGFVNGDSTRIAIVRELEKKGFTDSSEIEEILLELKQRKKKLLKSSRKKSHWRIILVVFTVIVILTVVITLLSSL
jgi:hypothetical protein